MANNKDKPKSTQEGKKWGDISNREVEGDSAFDPDLDSNLDEEEQQSGEKGVAGALEHPSYEGMEQKLTEAEQRAQTHYDGLLRSQAEFENLKKRMERELANAHKYAVDKLVEDLIPILDSLDQGLDINDFKQTHGEVIDKVREGMEMTYKMLLDLLSRYGVEQVDPAGHPFDPSIHEALSMAEDLDVEPNTVLKVVQKGYILHKRPIRPARVIVSK